MKLQLLPFFLFFIAALGAQTPSNLTLGGVRDDPRCKGTGDPNTTLSNQFPSYECPNYTDTVTGKEWSYYPTLTPKWRAKIDSAGSYLNQNVNGVVSLGGVSDMPVNTGVKLDMGGLDDGRWFTIGNFANPTTPSGPTATNKDYGLHLSPWNNEYEISLRYNWANNSSVVRLGGSSVVNEGIRINNTSVIHSPFDLTGKSSVSSIGRSYLGFQRNGTPTRLQGLGNVYIEPFQNSNKFGAQTGTYSAYQPPLVNGIYLSGVFSESSMNTDAAGTVTNQKNYVMLAKKPSQHSDSLLYSVILGSNNLAYSPGVGALNNGANYDMQIPAMANAFSVFQSKLGNSYKWINVDLDGTQTGNKVSFYNRSYSLANAIPSNGNGNKSVMVWTGDGMNAIPAFETLPIGLSASTVENGLEFVSGKIGQGSALVRNTTIPGAGFNYEMSALNQLLFTTTSGTRTTSIQANNTGAVGVNIVNTNTSTNDRGTVKANADSFSYLGNDNTVSGSTGVVQTYSTGQVDVKATDGGANTRIIRVEDDKMSLVNLAASSGGTFTKQIVLDPATYEIRIEDKTSVSPQEEFFTATGGQTAFTIAVSQAAPSGNTYPLRVYRNGVKLKYVASAPGVAEFTYSGTGITTAANLAGDIITAEYFN